MSEMIERAAEAAFMADWPKDNWSRFGNEDYVKNRYRRIARAAIEAMREPTKAQIEAAEDIVVGFDDFACGDGNIYLGIPGYPQKARDVWAALIDAALKENP